MFTRKDYMHNFCTHEQYYGQFVTPQIKNILRNYLGLDVILNSKNESFNDIPLNKWDILPMYHNSELQKAGDYLTPAGKVCILKEAARQLKIEHLNK